MAKITSYGEELKKKHPEKFKILVEAMNKTNGKCDNKLTEMLLLSENVSVEDVIRLGGSYKYDNSDDNYYCSSMKRGRVFWDEPKKYGTKEDRMNARIAHRRDDFLSKFEYKFKDSYLYNAMVKMGMDPSDEDGDWYDSKRTYSVNPHHPLYGGLYRSVYGGEKLADTKYAEVTMMYMRAGEDLRKAIMSSSSLSKLWTEQARVRREVDHIYRAEDAEKNPISSTNEEWRRFQSDHIIKEFGWLANMPDDVKKDLDGYMEDADNNNKRGYWRREKYPATLTNTILGAFRYPSTDKNIELVREAYQVMEYIGIGVCWNYVNQVVKESDGTEKTLYRDVYGNEKATGVGAMLKKVSSMMRRFTADMRKGFSPEDVRELIIEDLNGWAATKVGDRWKFYPRTDAPDEYEGFTKKKKQATEKVKLFNSKKSLELDENNPEDKGFFEVLNKLKNKEENNATETTE